MPRIVTRKRTSVTTTGTRVVTTHTAEAPDLEWRLQAAAVRRLRARPDYTADADKPGAFALAGDMNAGRRGRQEAVKAKATGLEAGEPDLRVYGANGRLLMIELKAENGKPSEAQINRHALLIGLGFMVVTIHATTEDEAADLVEATVEEWLAMACGAANDNEPPRLAA